MSEILRDHESERALIASILLTPTSLKSLLVDERLRPEHFAVDTHAHAFEALTAISDRGEQPDTLTLATELENRVPSSREFVAAIAADIGDSTPRAYARRIRDLHRRRDLKLAAALISQAADLGDEAPLAEAERLLTRPEDAEPSTWTPEQLQERFFDRISEGRVESWEWPFRKLNVWTGGGLRRQQVVLIGGFTAMGKSVLYDQILCGMAEQGLKCHSYINEMSESERMDRTVARMSGVSFSRVQSRSWSPEEQALALAALPKVRVGMTECPGWTAAEIARHIRWNRWDVAGVDILHEIPHREERDLAEIAQTLRSAAKQIGCALIACVHLNDNRVATSRRPVPVLRDVRGSGMLVRGADIVLFAHRDDDEDGVPTDEGVLVAAKIRQGQPNVMAVAFDGEHMRFTEQRSIKAPAASDNTGGNW